MLERKPLLTACHNSREVSFEIERYSDVTDRGYVIDDGAIRYHGKRRDLAENEEVHRKYSCV